MPESSIAKTPAPRDEVIAWLLEGQRDSDILQRMKERWPDADRVALLSSAVDHFEQAANCRLSVVVGWGLEAYKDLYRRMIAEGDLANAMKAVKELVALAAKHVHSEDDNETEDGQAATD